MTQHTLKLKTFAPLKSILTALCFFIWTGCSTTTLMHPKSNEELNAQLKGHDAIVEMKEGMELSVKEVHVTNDSVSWLDRETNIESRTGIGRLSKIKTINKNDHVLGALEGLGIGFVGTTAAFLSLSGFPSEIGGASGLAVAASVGLIGGGIGLVVGLISGFTYYDEFPLDEHNVSRSDSLKSPSR